MTSAQRDINRKLRISRTFRPPATFSEKLLVNRFIEHHSKAVGIAAHHFPHQAEPFFERENRELQVNGASLVDFPPGADKNTAGTDIPDQIPIGSFFNCIFGAE